MQFSEKNLSPISLSLSEPAAAKFGSAWPQTERRTNTFLQGQPRQSSDMVNQPRPESWALSSSCSPGAESAHVPPTADVSTGISSEKPWEHEQVEGEGKENPEERGGACGSRLEITQFTAYVTCGTRRAEKPDAVLRTHIDLRSPRSPSLLH